MALPSYHHHHFIQNANICGLHGHILIFLSSTFVSENHSETVCHWYSSYY